MKEQLRQIIDKYKEFDFSYSNCGKKEVVSISQDGKIEYKQKSQEEIEKMAERKKEFDALASNLSETYYQAYLNRSVPKTINGADTMARYVSKEDGYLFEYFDEVIESALKKHDVPTIASVCQTMELPFYYYKPVYSIIEKVCSETLPELAIACDHDTSKYVLPVTNVFCVLSMPKSHFVDCYNEGYKKLIESMMKSQSSPAQPE